MWQHTKVRCYIILFWWNEVQYEAQCLRVCVSVWEIEREKEGGRDGKLMVEPLRNITAKHGFPWCESERCLRCNVPLTHFPTSHTFTHTSRWTPSGLNRLCLENCDVVNLTGWLGSKCCGSLSSLAHTCPGIAVAALSPQAEAVSFTHPVAPTDHCKIFTLYLFGSTNLKLHNVYWRKDNGLCML